MGTLYRNCNLCHVFIELLWMATVHPCHRAKFKEKEESNWMQVCLAMHPASSTSYVITLHYFKLGHEFCCLYYYYVVDQ